MNDFIGASLSELGKKLSVRTHVYESMDVEQPFRGIEYTREGDLPRIHGSLTQWFGQVINAFRMATQGRCLIQ